MRESKKRAKKENRFFGFKNFWISKKKFGTRVQLFFLDFGINPFYYMGEPLIFSCKRKLEIFYYIGETLIYQKM
jgi:hypothetical protein